MNKEEVKKQIKKLGADKYASIVSTPERTVTVEINKEGLRVEYEALVEQHKGTIENLKSANKKIELNNWVQDDKMEEFIKMADSMKKYQESKRDIEVRDNILKWLKDVEKELIDIEKVAPELKRKVKN